MNTEHAKEDHSRCWKEKDIVSLIWEHAGITHPKPTKKVIDMSALIESGIDCEFWDGEGNVDWSMTKLISISPNQYPYRSTNNITRFCRPRMNHIHAWQGDECPLPDGFRVKVWLRNSVYVSSSVIATEMAWSHDNSEGDIIAFEVLGLADGYVMPWESE
jgi:hypothetical protein